MTVTDRLVGRSIKCPGCGKAFVAEETEVETELVEAPSTNPAANARLPWAVAGASAVLLLIVSVMWLATRNGGEAKAQAPTSAEATGSADTDALRGEVTSAKSRVKELAAQNDSIKQDLVKFKDRATVAEKEVAGLKEKVTTAEKEAAGLKEKVGAAEKELAGLKAKGAAPGKDGEGLNEKLARAEAEIARLKEDALKGKNEPAAMAKPGLRKGSFLVKGEKQPIPFDSFAGIRLFDENPTAPKLQHVPGKLVLMEFKDPGLKLTDVDLAEVDKITIRKQGEKYEIEVISAGGAKETYKTDLLVGGLQKGIVTTNYRRCPRERSPSSRPRRSNRPGRGRSGRGRYHPPPVASRP